MTDEFRLDSDTMLALMDRHLPFHQAPSPEEWERARRGKTQLAEKLAASPFVIVALAEVISHRQPGEPPPGRASLYCALGQSGAEKLVGGRYEYQLDEIALLIMHAHEIGEWWQAFMRETELSPDSSLVGPFGTNEAASILEADGHSPGGEDWWTFPPKTWSEARTRLLSGLAIWAFELAEREKQNGDAGALAAHMDHAAEAMFFAGKNSGVIDQMQYHSLIRAVGGLKRKRSTPQDVEKGEAMEAMRAEWLRRKREGQRVSPTQFARDMYKRSEFRVVTVESIGNAVRRWAKDFNPAS